MKFRLIGKRGSLVEGMVMLANFGISIKNLYKANLVDKYTNTVYHIYIYDCETSEKNYLDFKKNYHDLIVN